MPWSSFWEHNYFGLVSPAVRVFLTNDFVRGAVSGLCLLNLAAGVAEILPPFTSK